MRLTFASYNIHKAVGLDRRRDPERIMDILREIDREHGADVIALQEVDMRFGTRESVIPRRLFDDIGHGHSPWRAVAPRTRPGSLGWHGNVLLVRRDIEVVGVEPIDLPTLEPRGAICANLAMGGQSFQVAGMHLDLSGLRRRHQIDAVRAHFQRHASRPSVAMGDLNEWSPRRGALGAFGGKMTVLAPGHSFPARRPIAQLDRIVTTPDWHVEALGVHSSALAQIGSDHLPVWARLVLKTA
jgi:endonuclease/exonuclease/phosphatase family metal-dependent hydrolase